MEREAFEVVASINDDLRLPSIGSAGHESGECKRCAFVTKGKCINGYDCTFCHFTHDKKKRSKKQGKPGHLVEELGVANFEPLSQQAKQDQLGAVHPGAAVWARLASREYAAALHTAGALQGAAVVAGTTSCKTEAGPNRAGAWQTAAAVEDILPSENIFVHGLPANMTEDSMKTIFGAYGDVISARLLPARFRSDRAALLRMGDVDQAMWFVQNLNGNIPVGLTNSISVRYAGWETTTTASYVMQNGNFDCLTAENTRRTAEHLGGGDPQGTPCVTAIADAEYDLARPRTLELESALAL